MCLIVGEHHQAATAQLLREYDFWTRVGIGYLAEIAPLAFQHAFDLILVARSIQNVGSRAEYAQYLYS